MEAFFQPMASTSICVLHLCNLSSPVYPITSPLEPINMLKFLTFKSKKILPSPGSPGPTYLPSFSPKTCACSPRALASPSQSSPPPPLIPPFPFLSRESPVPSHCQIQWIISYPSLMAEFLESVYPLVTAMPLSLAVWVSTWTPPSRTT